MLSTLSTEILFIFLENRFSGNKNSENWCHVLFAIEGCFLFNITLLVAWKDTILIISFICASSVLSNIFVPGNVQEMFYVIFSIRYISFLFQWRQWIGYDEGNKRFHLLEVNFAIDLRKRLYKDVRYIWMSWALCMTFI